MKKQFYICYKLDEAIVSNEGTKLERHDDTFTTGYTIEEAQGAELVEKLNSDMAFQIQWCYTHGVTRSPKRFFIYPTNDFPMGWKVY